MANKNLNWYIYQIKRKTNPFKRISLVKNTLYVSVKHTLVVEIAIFWAAAMWKAVYFFYKNVPLILNITVVTEF